MNFTQFKKIMGFYGRFILSFTAIGFWFRKLFWRKLTPDFACKTILVTGASGGIGANVVLQSVEAKGHVLAVARNPEKLGALSATIGTDNAPNMTSIVTDLSLQSEIDKLVETCGKSGTKIDVLVNCVGVLLAKPETTSEGFELSFATNILNHYLLTEKLLEKNLLSDDAVIINVSSGGMYNAPLMTQPMNNPSETYSGAMAYALHKRAQVVLTQYWTQKYKTTAKKFYAMHPGWADTQGVKTSLPNFRKTLKSILRNEAMGADTILWLAEKRPDYTPKPAIWFDRKARKTHINDMTESKSVAVESLIEYLDAQILAKT